jgi:hypothetical protein
MVATFDVIYDWGGTDGTPGTSTDVDALGPPTIRFKNADDATIDTNNKLVVPGAGTKYSYWKHLYLKCSNADSHTINNVAVYSDGSNSLGTGIDCVIGLQFPTKNSGASTGYEVAGADEELAAGHGGITSVASIFNYTAGEANDLDVSISESGSVINAANETTNYILMQMTVASTASPGDLTDETATWSYDEA